MAELVLCADDYGLSEGVSSGILRLAEAERLSAVSCLAASPRWAADAVRIRPLIGRCDIGLHFALTDLPPLGPMPWTDPPMLGDLLRRAVARRIRPDDIAAELRRQLDAFEQALGRSPDFIDGHQHVHVLPGIRDGLIGVIESRTAAVWVRNCFEPPAAVVRRGVASGKALILSALARPLAKRLAAARIPCNDSFRGVNAFTPGTPARPMFRRFFAGPGVRPLVMCHPGWSEPSPVDPIALRRPEELAYLESNAFLEDLRCAGLELARFRLTG